MIKVTGLMMDIAGQLELLHKPMPVKITYALARAFEKMKVEQAAYNEAKQIIIKKHNMKPDRNGMIDIGSNPEFAKEIMELQNQEINLGMEKININLNDLPDLSLTEMQFLMYFVNITKENENGPVPDGNS